MAACRQCSGAGALESAGCVAARAPFAEYQQTDLAWLLRGSVLPCQIEDGLRSGYAARGQRL